MNREFGGFSFRFICKINPKKDNHGNFEEFFPQLRYEKQQKKLHKYGKGPFCKFSIPSRLNEEGVYLLLIDEKPVYVGECESFSNRWNTGYGNISPRACYEGGQSTNCRINNLILTAKKNSSNVELYFFEIFDRFGLEADLIQHVKPNWNKTIGKPSLSKRAKTKEIISKKVQKTIRKLKPKGFKKYQKLSEFLKSISNQETLTFDEIQNILGFKLPSSAFKHKAWWSNGGHAHAFSWLDAGCKVTNLNMGKNVTFKKFSN